MRKPQVEGHWHSLIGGFSTSSLDFYELVKAGIERRKIPDLTISKVEWREGGVGSGNRVYLRVSREHLNFDICAAPFGTGYFFSWWLARIPRVLLDFGFLLGTLVFGGLIMQIALREGEGNPGCFSVFFGPLIFFGVLLGLGCMVRYGEMGFEPTVLSMPITGFLYQLVFRPSTYFNEDTALMFRESVHHAVLEAIDEVTSAQGVRALTDEERRMPSAPVPGKPTVHVHLT